MFTSDILLNKTLHWMKTLEFVLRHLHSSSSERDLLMAITHGGLFIASNTCLIPMQAPDGPLRPDFKKKRHKQHLRRVK